MSFSGILIANRAEIAIRISRAASALGIRSVGIFSADDKTNLHVAMTDEVIELEGSGPKAYLDLEQVVEAAKKSGCDAIHPGYGFLSERSELAERCRAEGITFIGPRPEHLELFGNKSDAKVAAKSARVPTLRGTDEPAGLEDAINFFDEMPHGIVIKAVAGGGGRGTRIVTKRSDIPEAFQLCQSEAMTSFGNDDVYLEEFMALARHIEVQVLGDQSGNIVHLYERECSVQRRNQKILEIAPAPNLSNWLREELISASMRFARAHRYESLGTFEFLVDMNASKPKYAFIETNARLQVEHTVTEEVTGFDLVKAQIQIAAGATLSELGFSSDAIPEPRGFAIQSRVNLETLQSNGSVLPAAGSLAVYEVPNGPGVRTDGFGYSGYQTSNAFDSLLAKVIVHSNSRGLEDVSKKTIRALTEFRITGVKNNLAFLKNILAHPDFVGGRVHTRWVEENSDALSGEWAPDTNLVNHFDTVNSAEGLAGAKVDTSDPMALFEYDRESKSRTGLYGLGSEGESGNSPEGWFGVASPIQGTVVSIEAEVGEEVAAGQSLAIVEAMKMEHVISSDRDGIVRRVSMKNGDVVREGFPIIFVEEAEVSVGADNINEVVDLDYIRPDLQENIERHAFTLDENRREAVERRRARGGRMPRENIAELMDPGSFKEYWPLIVARQHKRYDPETLRKNTPADGVVAGTGTVNRDLFGEEQARAMIVHYDYTVLAGTQGGRNHYKQDRMFELALRFRLPLVLFGEGGGGRPGDDSTGPSVAFDTHTFSQFSKLSGAVPLVGVNHGRCFAGNTALLACCDVIIATKGSTIAMGGPAMIEGGGLGIYTPEEVGPMSFQVPNGVVDILVNDEQEAVIIAKKYLSYFQGELSDWKAPEQKRLRHIVPENRLRLYEMRDIIKTLADEGSVLEIRKGFGVGIITCFIRVEGRPLGVIANNPHHLAGAIDSDGADKGARFMQLCDAFDIPILSLMDCPGIMVGPEVEATALVRHSVRMFNTGANLTTPLFGVVVRKAYGLGVQAMCGASSLEGFFTVAWPTAEFAGMNIEGAVKLGYRKELMSIEDPKERAREFEERVARAYESAKAVNAAAGGGIDDVIDPAETRSWLAESLKRVPPAARRETKKYPFVDTW